MMLSMNNHVNKLCETTHLDEKRKDLGLEIDDLQDWCLAESVFKNYRQNFFY